jgi:hypothetical protein
MPATPGAKRFHQRDEYLTFGIEGIADLRRDRTGRFVAEYAIGCKLAELIRGHFFGNLGELSTEFSKAPGPEG